MSAPGFTPVRLLRPHWPRLAGGALCLGLLALTSAGYALITGPVLQVLLTGRARGLELPLPVQWLPAATGSVLVSVAVLVGGLALLKGLSNLGQAMLLEGAAEQIGRTLRTRVFHHLVHLPLSWHRKAGVGDTVARLVDDVQQVQQAAVQAPITLVREGLGVLALLGVALWMSPTLTLTAAVALPLVGLAIGLLSRGVKTAAAGRQRQLGRLMDRAVVALGAIREVKSSGAELREVATLDQHGSRVLHWAMRRIALRATAPLVNELMAAAALGVTLVLAAPQIASGALAPHRFVSFFAALLMIYRPVKSVGQAVHQMASGAASVERVARLLEQRAEAPRGEPLPRLTRAMRLSGIRFRYDEGPRTLCGVDLELVVGQVVALAGRSGAGKSTLASVVCGLERADHGCLFWDEVEITGRPLAALREQAALVPQQPLLLPATLAENLRYGAPQATDDDLARALVRVGLEHLSTRHPQGIEVRLGPPHGLGLSVGEAQRLAVARALLRQVGLLVLDEPSSALDCRSEEHLVRLLREVRRTHAVLVVAHSPVLLAAADRVVHLEDVQSCDGAPGEHGEGMVQCQGV